MNKRRHCHFQTGSAAPQFNLQLCKPVLSICLIAILSGCAAFVGYPKRVTDPAADLDQLKSQIEAKAITTCLDAPTLTCRNKIIAARMHATDIRFSEFEETLFRQTREAGFGSTVATLGLTSAAAISTGGASQVLSGIAAFIIGGREAFQKEVLAERTVIAIHTAMRAKRAQIAIRLRGGLGQPLDRYPLALGLGDLNEYYSAGTVLGALVGITETVSATAQKAEADLQTTISFKLDESAQKFERAICGGESGCPNPDVAKYPAIRACWPKVEVPTNTPMTDFIFQQSFAKQRELVAKCMGL